MTLLRTGSAIATTAPKAAPLPSAGVHTHLIGCCGTGMKGLADLLHGLGLPLSGSDCATPPESLQALIRRGFDFHEGHAAENLPPQAQRVIRSLAIGAENPELQAAVSRGLEQLTYGQMVGRLMSERVGVCIAGTHGKSTTTAMTACLLSDCGFNPSAIFGADLCRNGTSSWAGAGDLFVVESCEFQRNFLDYHPRYAAILSVEPDHFDCYRSREELIAAFGAFAAQVDPSGFILTRIDDPAAMEATQAATAPVLTFGWNPEADWWAGDVRRTANGSRFRLFRRGQFVTELQVPVPGRHNVLNALAAAAIALELGAAPRDVRASLPEFPGIRRRFENLGSWRGVTVIDDYAHHPTAVEATLQTARELFGRRTLRVAFQPHQVTRTAALLEEFRRAFHRADEVIVAPVFAARESVGNEPVELAAALATGMREHGVSAQACMSLDHVVRVLDDALQPGDVLITMGAGDIDRIHHALTRRISRDSAAGRTAGPLHMVEGGWTGPVLSYSA